MDSPIMEVSQKKTLRQLQNAAARVLTKNSSSSNSSTLQLQQSFKNMLGQTLLLHTQVVQGKTFGEAQHHIPGPSSVLRGVKRPDRIRRAVLLSST